MKKKLKTIMALSVCCVALSSHAAVCTLSTIGINFGAYDVFNVTPLEGIGTIDVVCDVRTPFTVMLSTGISGNYTTRQMANGTHRLNYNVYRNAAMTRVLGDGTGNTFFWNVNRRRRSFTVYGRIAPQQNVFVGSYSDTLMVTLTF